MNLLQRYTIESHNVGEDTHIRWHGHCDKNLASVGAVNFYYNFYWLFNDGKEVRMN